MTDKSQSHGLDSRCIQTIWSPIFQPGDLVRHFKVMQRLVGLCYGGWSAASGAVLRRGVRSGLCRSDILTAAELIEDLDDDLFLRILRDKNHMLPDRQRSLDYGLWPRSHRELAPKASSLIESNFLIR